MVKSRPVIITCAPTGGIHTPTMSKHLPITPDEIATASIDAAEAGASIIHLHARDPETGKPDADPELFMQFLPRIKQSTNAVVNVDRRRAGDPRGTSSRGHPRQPGNGLSECRVDGLASSRWPTNTESGSLTGNRSSGDDTRFHFPNTFADLEYVVKELGEGLARSSSSNAMTSAISIIWPG